MLVYVIDNTLESFFTAIYKHYYDKKCDLIFRNTDYLENLCDEVYYITEDFSLAEKVNTGLKKKFTDESYNLIIDTLHNSEANAVNNAFNFLKMAMTDKENSSKRISDTRVMNCIRLSKQVKLEAHRMNGFIRFSIHEDILYSFIEPDHDILEYLISHFKARFKNENFMIVDKIRKKALLYSKGRYEIVLNVEIKEALSRKDEFEDYWKSYFKKISIVERENKKCQRNSLPLRYRKNMIEF